MGKAISITLLLRYVEFRCKYLLLVPARLGSLRWVATLSEHLTTTTNKLQRTDWFTATYYEMLLDII